jgi:hypothetical protein
MNNRTIISGFFPISELQTVLQEFVKEYFKYSPNFIDYKIEPFIKLLRDDLNFYIEYPYVDKVFRDSFYNFYSTKHNLIDRDCARISFFKDTINETDFRDTEFEFNDELFFGYISIRPTLPNLIGRTMLSPRAYKLNGFLCCLVSSNVVINGKKLNIDAFPHSSQDGETITCAETTIWSVMEYFGIKYPEYKPVLPSKILNALANYSYERQLPSRGLTAEQISFALKEFDFGTRLYSQKSDNEDVDAYSETEFKRLLGYYIESGIPLIASIENDNVGHAIVIMGRKEIDLTSIEIDKYEPQIISTRAGKIELYDFADFADEIIAIDDNMPPYNIIPFSNPTKNYDSPEFQNCEIQNFIVPLYHKIYLEAGGARELMISYLQNFNHKLPGNQIIFKLFYTSSRSFKTELNQRINIGEETNEIILNTTMPKFIWVGLLTNPELLRKKKANGLVVLDATGAKTYDSSILMVSPSGVTAYDSQEETGNKYVVYDTKINSFNIFANNLKGEWSQWQS